MIYGKIIDDSGNVIELVNVAVMGSSYGTSSNSRGQYELHLPSDTDLEIVFSFVGYKQVTKNIKLKKGEERKIDVVMEYTSVTLPDAVVSDRKINSATITRLDARKITFVPSSGAGGVEDLVKTLPGVSSTNELSSQYNVRGGNFDENLTYINGIEIYKPFLVGSGQQEGMSIINPKLISNIDFSAGGFSAEYGDKLSSVLDITYKRPLLTEASFTMSFLGLEAHAEGTTILNASELGITPQNDGKVIRLNFPPLTEERRRELVKTVKKYAEESKVQIRNARRDGIEAYKKQKKDGEITEDDLKTIEKDIQDLTDKYIKEIDEITADKEKEITEI